MTDGDSAALRWRRRTLIGLIGAAVAVSVVHYADNTIRWDDFIAEDPGDRTLGWITRWMIPLSWLAFTACAARGCQRFGQRRWPEAAAWLGAYSMSGLVGLAHYVDVPMAQLSAFQNAHVLTDVILGAGVLAFAVHLAFRPPPHAHVDARPTT